MMLQVVLLKADGYWYAYRQVGEEPEKPIVHRPVVAKRQIVRNLVYRCNKGDKR
jgi:hypothetical protein